MAREPDVKKIIKEDFSEADQETIDKLGYSLNTFMDQVRDAFIKSIDFNNLNEEIITLDITVNASGVPNIVTQYRSTLKTRVIGHQVLNATNLTSPLNTPISWPGLVFVQNNALVNINRVTGLQPNEKYRLVVRSTGDSIP